MYCESCGKKLIRGYQFCMECGTPVPPEANEDEATEAAAPSVESGSTMPDIQPISNDGGSLVFCSDCGMHMQSSTAFCEKCGKPLGNTGMNPNAASGGGVPLINSDPLGNDFGGISDGDIDRINDFMNGGGITPLDGMGGAIAESTGISSGDMGSIGGAAPVSDIDELTRQLASFGASTDNMPAIGVEPAPTELRQVEPKPGEAREMQNFAMDGSAYSNDKFSTDVPVIDGGSMDENPDEDVSLDPYAFVNNVLTNDPVPAVEPVTPVIEDTAPAAEPSGASVEDLIAEMESAAPVIEEVAPVEPVAPVIEPVSATVDDIISEMQAAVPAVEPAAPVIEEVASVEPVAPVIEPVSATVDDIISEMQAAVPAVEPAAPVIEEVAPVEPVAPVIEPVSATVDDIISEMQAAAPAVEPAAPVVEEVASVEPVAPVIEPVSAAVDDIISEMQAAVPAVEPAAPVIEEATVVEPVAPVIEEASPFIAEEPVIPEPAPAPVMSAPAPAPAPIPVKRPAPDQLPAEDPVLGKLSYCRNCGQDMYENEPACKNCGAPYKPPKKHDTSLDNRGKGAAAEKKNSITKFLPAIIGAGAVVAVVAVVLLTTPKDDSGIKNNPSVTTPATSASVSEPENTSAPEQTDAPAPEQTDTTTTTAPEQTDTPAPEQTDASSASEQTDASSVSEPEDTSAPEQSSATTPRTTPTGTTRSSATGTSSGTTTVTTTTTKAVAAITSPKTVSLEKDREAIMDAAALISGEVGKIEALAQNVIYAMDNASGNAETARSAYMNRDFAKNILASLESGKTTADSAVANAKPKNSELNSMYDALLTLQKKYNAYYSFIKNPSGSTSKYTSSCSTYLSDFTSAANAMKYTKFTGSYTTAEQNAAYKAALSDAVTAANNAITAFNTLQTKISAVDKNNFDTAAITELSKAANSKAFATAASYAHEVAVYRIMLSGAPSAYSGAYNDLKNLSDQLNALVDLYNMLAENDLSSFKSESSSCLSAANKAASAVTKAIS